MLLILAALVAAAGARAQEPSMQPIAGFAIDRTEVTVSAFAAFAESTGFESAAETAAGGLVYDAGWTRKPGWTWRTPFGAPADPQEPAVHLTYDEAAAYCDWRGARLPTDAEWVEAAYVERRPDPPGGFMTGRRYPYPTGDSPLGANCLGDCGETPALDRTDRLRRGVGPARAGAKRAGVNGLHDMGANVWEWVDEGGEDKRTRGGSWWYGAGPMREDHLASKPRDMAVVYIGFRCAKDLAAAE